MSFNIHNGRVYPKGVFNNTNINRAKRPANTEAKISFHEILKNELTFSKHALKRVSEREIHISNEDMDKLNDAFKKAQDKGCRESLLIYKNKGFITSIQNRKIITVCDLDNGDGVVTNIDSVLIV